jgi:hypothetical protein
VEFALPTSRVCQSCDRFVANEASTNCPDCGGEMRLTFLPPPDHTPVDCPLQLFGRSDWEREYARLSEPIEQPIKARLTQIATGLGIQALVFQAGIWIVRHTHSEILSDLSELTDLSALAIPLYLVAMVLGLFVLSTVVGGGTAGAWCINWGLQGVAVGVGFLAIVAAKIAFFVPWSLLSKIEIPPIFCALLAAGAIVTVALTTIGALLGHLLIRPIRVPLDAAR